MKIATCAPVDCSLADPSGAVAVDWSSQKSDEDSSERGREWRDMWPVGLQENENSNFRLSFSALIRVWSIS